MTTPERALKVKSLLLLTIMSFPLSPLVMAQATDCLGFPSAEFFDCTLDDGTVLEFDIPAGSNCNQGPKSGEVSLDGETVRILNPKVSMNSHNQRVVSYNMEDFEGDDYAITCQDSKDL